MRLLPRCLAGSSPGGAGSEHVRRDPIVTIAMMLWLQAQPLVRATVPPVLGLAQSVDWKLGLMLQDSSLR